jgi:tRNA-Thr(GGU) m(6)t(6)A37 methyltransferase TsaA
MERIEFNPIGIIRSPYSTTADMPIQPAAALGVRGSVEVFPAFAPGLKDLDGFSHIILLYHFHLSNDYKLEVRPFLDNTKRGVFATRAPKRPNQIGLSVVKLVSVHENILVIENVDILTGTPLLDIKPYIPDMDATGDVRTGWFSRVKANLDSTTNDGRFEAND